MPRLIYFSIVAFVLFSCSGKQVDTEESEAARASFSSENNFVDTMVLKLSDFKREIITNGKLRALKKSDLAFRTNGIIKRIPVVNGSYVKQGDIIAQLDNYEANKKLQQAKERREKAELDFADKLISYGYARDTSDVPSDMLKVIKIQSGYNQVLHDYNSALEELENTNLKAPFGGKVADIKGREYESASSPFCTLIDDSGFEVEFSLLESELSFIKTGSPVKISSFSDPDVFYQGSVTQINPLVDDKGQIKVMARVANTSGKLLEGMNVKVVAQNILKGHLVVPKGAVVMRDNFDVLFRLDQNTNKAMWTYVEVLMTNTDSHAVVANKEKNAQMDVGDIIIISGNLNLADGSNVVIKNK